MKKFLVNMLIFVIPLLGFFILNSAINLFIIDYTGVDLGEQRVLIMGDSHSELGIDPGLFEDGKNISQGDEPYILTFWKLNKILETNKPEMVILGFSPHNISQVNDVKFYDLYWCEELFRRSYPIGKFNEVRRIIPINFPSYYKIMWKQTSFYPKLNHGDYIGKYSNSESSNISNYKKSINRHYYWNGSEPAISEVSIKYLDSIITLCSKNNIPVILANPPVHINYYKGIPENILTKYESLKSRYKTKVAIKDNSYDFSYPDSLFFDSDHLNKFGARKYTTQLLEMVNDKARK